MKQKVFALTLGKEKENNIGGVTWGWMSWHIAGLESGQQNPFTQGPKSYDLAPFSHRTWYLFAHPLIMHCVSKVESSNSTFITFFCHLCWPWPLELQNR